MKNCFQNIIQIIAGRAAIDRRNRRRLKNRNITIIASSCNGGVIYHDLGLPFLSPFINLWIMPDDFIKLMKNLEEYLSFDLVFMDMKEKMYPVARLNDIYLYFQHYKTEEEAKSLWEKRLKRINFDNLAVFLLIVMGAVIKLFSNLMNCLMKGK